MAKTARSQKQRIRGNAQAAANDEILFYERPVTRESRPLEPKTLNQKRYLSCMKAHTLTVATGPAGTGKTFLCTALAAQMLQAHQINKIILTRPAVEAGESLGFLPGELEEKFDPYMQPYRDVLEQRLGKSHVECLIKRGQIVTAPLAYMRGTTFRDAFVILDEAQNTTPAQMKMFLTRIGENSKVVVNGDIDQSDLRGPSGLEDAVGRLQQVSDCGFVEFTMDDIVRHDLVGRIIRAYNK
jgi:phosphate starvation-inducible PhoH-like protein